MKHRRISRQTQGAPSVQSDILGALDAIVASVEGFVSAARVPLCTLEDTTTTYLEQLLHIDHTLLPVDAHWSGRNGEGTTVVWVPRDLVERLVVDCRLLSSVPSLQVEAECPLTVWNSSGPGLLVHWLNLRICMLPAVRTRRPHFTYPQLPEPEDDAIVAQIERIITLVFFGDRELWRLR